jgi:hypothetical protein
MVETKHKGDHWSYPGANDEPQKKHGKSPDARVRRNYQEAPSIGLGTAK